MTKLKKLKVGDRLKKGDFWIYSDGLVLNVAKRWFGCKLTKEDLKSALCIRIC